MQINATDWARGAVAEWQSRTGATPAKAQIGVLFAQRMIEGDESDGAAFLTRIVEQAPRALGYLFRGDSLGFAGQLVRDGYSSLTEEQHCAALGAHHAAWMKAQHYEEAIAQSVGDPKSRIAAVGGGPGGASSL